MNVLVVNGSPRGEDSNTMHLVRRAGAVFATGSGAVDSDRGMADGTDVVASSAFGAELFEYYEYTQCPIEPYAITLERFKSLLSELLKYQENNFIKTKIIFLMEKNSTNPRVSVIMSLR